MRYDNDGSLGVAPGWYAAQSGGRERFLVRTYNTLFGAIALFAGIEFALFLTGLAEPIARAMLGTSWLLVLGAFVVVSWFAAHVSRRAASLPAQVAALAAYVLAEAIIFVPLLYVADRFAPGTIRSAGLVTLVGFGGLTGIAIWTRKDFSFLGSILRWGFILALVAIGASLLLGFQLGTLFSVAMVGLAGGAILYDTSRIIRDYPEDRFVAAALELFSSVALMFWYVLRLFLGSSRR